MERNTVRTRIRKVYLKYWTESYSDISILIRFIIRFDSDSKKNRRTERKKHHFITAIRRRIYFYDGPRDRGDDVTNSLPRIYQFHETVKLVGVERI